MPNLTTAAAIDLFMTSATQGAARTNLALIIGVDVQPFDTDLSTWAGITPGANVGTMLATFSSANIKTACTDETGSGALVFGTNPTIDGATLTNTTTAATVTATALNATTLNVNGGATPSVAAFGDISSDNNSWAASRGAIVFYDGTASTTLVGVLTSDTPSNGDVPTWNTGGTITWEAPGGGSVANPTGTIGLAAVNGVASSAIRSDGAPALSQAIVPTWTGTHTFSKAGAASTPAIYATGAVLTGGTGTTNFPHIFYQPTGATAATTWSTSGTAFGVNMPTGFSGNFFDLCVAGTSVIRFDSNGAVIVTGSIASLAGPGLSLGAGNPVYVTDSFSVNGAPAAATTTTKRVKAVTGISDNTGTAVLTVTIPNAAHSATLRVTLSGAAGAGGAIGAREATASANYDFAIARTTGVNAVVAASTVYGSCTASVSGGTVLATTGAASAISGAVGATNTFTVNVTIAHTLGASTNHTCVVSAEIINAAATGITIA